MQNLKQEKFQYRKWFQAFVVLQMLILTACGGSSDPGVTTPVASTTLSGTAAAGAAIVGQVTVKGSLGVTRSALIEADGSYDVDVTGLTAPYRLRAQGTVGGRTYKLHSYAEAADVGGNVNITPFTDLIIANAAQQVAESYFDSNTPADLDPAVVAAQEAALQAKLQDVFTALGIGSAINLLNDTFSADHTGLDAVLDIVRIEVDATLNVATITNLIDSTTLEDSITDATDNSGTLAVTDAGSLTTAVGDIQAIASKFDALTAAFANGLPTAASIEDIFATDFYEEDTSLGLFLTDITTDPTIIGLGFGSIVVSNLDSVAGTADATFTFSVNGISDLETETWFVAKDAILGWQLRGNQRIVETNFSFHCNDNDGAGPGTGGCGVNTRFWDNDFSNNETADVPIASGTVSIIDGSDGTTKGVIFLGTPDFAAPGDVQVYDEANQNYTGDYKGFGTALGQIDPDSFAAGDMVQYDLYTTALDVSSPPTPKIDLSGSVIASYTDSLTFAPSTIPLIPTATASTQSAITNFTMGNDLVIAWTLAVGTRNSEVLVLVSDNSGNRIETWIETLGTTATSQTFASTLLNSAAATDAGLDSTATTYNLLVRIYADDELTGQAHSRDYNATIPRPGEGGSSSTIIPISAASLPGTYIWNTNAGEGRGDATFNFIADGTGTVHWPPETTEPAGHPGYDDTLTWSIDNEGRIEVVLFGEGGGVDYDRYTLISGTLNNGVMQLEVKNSAVSAYMIAETYDWTMGVSGTLACSFESGWDDTADVGLGAPIMPKSFADYEGTLADCGSAMVFTAAGDVAGNTFVDVDEFSTFNALGGAAGTEADPGTGFFDDGAGGVINFEWWIEAPTCSGCMYSYLVQYSDTTIDPAIATLTGDAGFWFRETLALTAVSGTQGVAGALYTYHKYSEQSNYSDLDRATGADGEIWFSADTLQ
jgi:hypothetical protein